MRKFVLPLAIVATLATSSMALAVTNNTVTGAIRAIDAKAETVTVGKTVYHFAKGTSLSAFKVGERVVIKAHAYKKIEVGVSIAAAPAPAPKPAPAKTVTKTVTKTTTTK
jgi:dTDP-4-dehydrorhamnose reductase